MSVSWVVGSWETTLCLTQACIPPWILAESLADSNCSTNVCYVNKQGPYFEMVGWHHRLSGCKFEQTPGDSEGQGSLAYCSPCVHKESDMTEQLNSNFLHTVNLGMDREMRCPE